jgi:RES domain-containing protein
VTDRLYPRSRVEPRIVAVALSSAYRIVWNRHVATPLDLRATPSRFCDGRSFAVVYVARSFETAFIEVVVRDRFVQKNRRTIPYGDLTARSWIRFSTKSAGKLSLLDLRETGCLDIGAPTDATHARNHAAGRALGGAIYRQHRSIDGFLYPSRLTGSECLVIFDRAASKLHAIESGGLVEFQELPDVLDRHAIALEVD